MPSRAASTRSSVPGSKHPGMSRAILPRLQLIRRSASFSETTCNRAARIPSTLPARAVAFRARLAGLLTPGAESELEPRRVVGAVDKVGAGEEEEQEEEEEEEEEEKEEEEEG